MNAKLNNITRLTDSAKSQFLETLENNGGIVTDAADSLSISRQTLYYHRNTDKDFALAWDKAVERGIDVLEDEAKRRALEGTPEPVFYQGIVCGTIMKKSDALMIRILQAHKEKYKPKAEISGDPNRPLLVVTNIPGLEIKTDTAERADNSVQESDS